MRIISYNINGLKKFLKKDSTQTTLDQFFFNQNKQVNKVLDFDYLLSSTNVDIICLQEIRLQSDFDESLLKNVRKLYKSIHLNINTSSIKAYSGVAIFSKIKIDSIFNDFDAASRPLQEKFNSYPFSKEGRIITAFFESFILINIYVPNSKIDFSRLEERGCWEDCLSSYIYELTSHNKYIIITGDFNVSLSCNITRSTLYPGFHPNEISWFSDLLSKTNLVDCFDSNSSTKYSHTYGYVKSKFDYVLCSQELHKKSKYIILDQYKLSDHLPLQFDCDLSIKSLNKQVSTTKHIVNENLSLTLIEHFYSPEMCKKLWDEIIESKDFKRPHTNKNGLLSKKRNKIVYGSIETYKINYLGKEISTPVIHWNKVPLIKQLAEQCGSITGEIYNTCTIQYYNNGKVNIKPHRDKEMTKGTYIVSLSLGSTRVMKFESCKTKKVVDCELKEGMLCVINPPTNDYWLHSIPEDSTVKPRISVIFRKYNN